jgi:hypothetical protein
VAEAAVPALPTWSVATLVGLGLGLLACTVANPFAFVPDDSLFYLVIARNIAAGDGITFSVVMGTNGFQPLWQAVVALLTTLIEALGVRSDAAQLTAVVLLCWALLAIGLVLLERLLRHLRTGPAARFAALGAVLVLLGGPYGTLATEANLVLVALVVVLLAARSALAAGTDRGALLLGLAIGFLMLARLDTVFVAATTLVTVLVVMRRSHGTGRALRSVLVAGATAAVAMVPYLAWNQVRFGHLNPISGAEKLDFSRIWLTPEAVGTAGWLLVASALAFGAVAAVLAPHRPGLWPWAAITSGAIAACAFYFLFSPDKLTQAGWYQAPHILAFALGTALVVDRAVERIPRLAPVVYGGAVALVALAIVFLLQFRVQGPNADQADEVRRFGAAADAALPDDAVVATIDYPGYVALTTRRPTIALDGLTGDYAFQDDLRTRGAACALATRGATHLVTDPDNRLRPIPGSDPPRYEQDVTSWLYDEPAGVLVVSSSDRVLAESSSGLGLWTLDASCP